MNEIINLGNGQFIKVTMFKGERGSNIATITKTGTSGLVDTYTITLTDGSTTSFEVKNGSSIDHITKTSSVGSVDTYTIYLTDGTVGGTFEVNNAIATVEQNFSSTSTNPLMNKTLTNIIAGVENGSTASKTYYANDLILRNDSLYEVSTTVAVGSAWADGVNISETTLGDLVSQINADLINLRGSIMPVLDFANPIPTFSDNNLSFTATDTCYLFGGFNNDVGRNFSINNTPILNPTANAGDNRILIPMIKLHAGDTVAIIGAIPQPYLHVYHEVTI